MFVVLDFNNLDNKVLRRNYTFSSGGGKRWNFNGDYENQGCRKSLICVEYVLGLYFYSILYGARYNSFGEWVIRLFDSTSSFVIIRVNRLILSGELLLG